MTTKRVLVQVNNALTFEPLGDEWVVLDQGMSEVHRLSGPSAEVFSAAIAGAVVPAGCEHAVAGNGTGNRVMTSPDGTTWTSRTSAADNTWRGVTYGNGLFVAVCEANVSGFASGVMTSPG